MFDSCHEAVRSEKLAFISVDAPRERPGFIRRKVLSLSGPREPQHCSITVAASLRQ